MADTRQQPLENQSVMVPSVSQSVTPFLQLSKVTLARVRVSTMASPIGRLYMCSMLSRVWAVRARGRAAAAQPPCPDTRASGGPSASRDSSTLVSTGYCSRRLDAIPSATHFDTKSQTAMQTASRCGLTKHDWLLGTVQSLRPKVNSGRFLTKLGSFLDNNSFC